MANYSPVFTNIPHRSSATLIVILWNNNTKWISKWHLIDLAGSERFSLHFQIRLIRLDSGEKCEKKTLFGLKLTWNLATPVFTIAIFVWLKFKVDWALSEMRLKISYASKLWLQCTGRAEKSILKCKIFFSINFFHCFTSRLHFEGKFNQKQYVAKKTVREE